MATSSGIEWRNHRNTQGELNVFCNGEKYSSAIANLWKGTCTLNFELPEHTKIGTAYEFEVHVTDPSRIAPFINAFIVEVKGLAPDTNDSKESERKDPIKHGKGEEHKPSTLGIPNVIEVNKENWHEYNFNGESALLLRQSSAGYYFVVNVDNIFLQNEQKRVKDDPFLLKEQFKYGLSLIGLALLNDDEKRKDTKSSEEEEESGSIDDLISAVTKAIAPFILPIVRELGSIEKAE